MARPLDVALVVVLAVGAIPNALPGLTTHDVRRLDIGGALLLAIAFVALVWRRAQPLPTLIAVTLVTIAYGVRNYPDSIALGAALVVALYASGRYGEGSRRNVVIALTIAAAGVASFAGGRQSAGGAAIGAALDVVVALVGDRQRLQAVRVQLVEERATQREQRARDEARRAAALERHRIARELHDVIAHSLSVIVVQASASAHVLVGSEAEGALRKIEDAARDTIGEMRTLLDVLRSDDDADEDFTTATRLEQLPALLDNARDAGLTIDYRAEGDVRELPPIVDLSAYRIIQEALTNVVRHAPGAQTDVRLTFGQRDIAIAVCNRGGRAPSSNGAPGYGLTGMAERAAILNGEFAAGPSRDGFEVTATLPIADSTEP